MESTKGDLCLEQPCNHVTSSETEHGGLEIINIGATKGVYLLARIPVKIGLILSQSVQADRQCAYVGGRLNGGCLVDQQLCGCTSEFVFRLPD